MEETYGAWTVHWDPGGFSVHDSEGRSTDSFLFTQIVLPVDLVLSLAASPACRAVVKLENARRVDVLIDASTAELERFKRRVSAEVLAVVRRAPFGCSDCARDAGIFATMWDGLICPGCREHYCRNAKCLRRLKIVVHNQIRLCKYCGAENASRETDS